MLCRLDAPAFPDIQGVWVMKLESNLRINQRAKEVQLEHLEWKVR